jgi:voltage-gated potassium channel
VETLGHLREFAKKRPTRPHLLLRRRIGVAIVFVAIVDVVGSLLMWGFEDEVGRSQIHNLWDAFFFSSVQILTVSSSMLNPVTTPGRIVDIFLMLVGVGLVSGLAGAFASFFRGVDRTSAKESS